MNMKFLRKIANCFFRKKILSNGSCRVRVLFCAFRYWPKERIRNFERAERELEQLKGKLLHVKKELDFSNNQLAIKNKALLASLNSLSEVEKMSGVTQQQLSESQKMLVVTQQQLSESQKMLVVTQQQLSESQKQKAITKQQLNDLHNEHIQQANRLKDTQATLTEVRSSLKTADNQLLHTKQQLSELQQQYRKSESSLIHFRNKLKHLVICPETIRKDGRFIVSDDFYQRSLLNTKILKYEIVKIKLKDIRREWDGKLLGLTECHPYRYLEGDVQQYLDYVERNKTLGGYEMSTQRFDELIQSLSEVNYDPRYMPFINENNVIYDGQHRCCFLMKKYGGEYEIEAVRIICTRL